MFLEFLNKTVSKCVSKKLARAVSLSNLLSEDSRMAAQQEEEDASLLRLGLGASSAEFMNVSSRCKGLNCLPPPLRFPKCKLLAQLGGRHSFGAPTTDGRSARGGRGRALQVRLPAVFSPFHRRVLTPRAFFSVFLKTLSYVQRFSRYKTKAAVKEVRRYPRPAACTLPVRAVV